MRQFIYAHDLAHLMIWTLEHYDASTDSGTLILSVDPADEGPLSSADHAQFQCHGLIPSIASSTA